MQLKFDVCDVCKEKFERTEATSGQLFTVVLTTPLQTTKKFRYRTREREGTDAGAIMLDVCAKCLTTGAILEEIGIAVPKPHIRNR